MAQETQDDKPSPYIRLKEGDPERVERLVSVLQKTSLGRVNKNDVVHEALNVLEAKVSAA